MARKFSAESISLSLYEHSSHQQKFTLIYCINLYLNTGYFISSLWYPEQKNPESE
jgi:hypothetical protein